MLFRQYSSLFLAAIITGCANLPVSERGRTSSDSFDGLWRGKIAGTEMRQHAADWELTCNELELGLVAQVADGRITGYLEEDENITFTANLSNRGRFYSAIPKQAKSYRASISSDERLDGREYYVFRGRLRPDDGIGNGDFILASADLLMGGCTTPIHFSRG